MPAPISMDLRLAGGARRRGGSSIRAGARRFSVSLSAAIKLMQRVRPTGRPHRRATAATAGRFWNRN